MITIPILANFLSIDVKDIKEINVVEQNEEQIIVITPVPKDSACPNQECECDKTYFKGYRNRKIMHSLFLNKPTTFIYKVRMNKCLRCGKTFSEANFFAPKNSRVSYETIRIVLEAARNYNSTWKEISEKAHISDTTAINIFDRYVNIPRGMIPRIMCIDECYNKHQFSKPYSCILFDFESSKIVDVIEDRSKHHLSSYFNKIKKEERENVQYIIIDMWEPYLDLAQVFFPKAIVAIDSFHVMKEIGFALDKVRRRVMHKYQNGTKEYYLLKHWNRTLFFEQKIYEEKHKIRGYDNKYLNRYQIQELILALDSELKAAQDFYIRYKNMNKLTKYEDVEKRIDDFINDKIVINIPEFISVLQMLQNWKTWIVNSFIVVDGRRISNGPIEGFNSNFKKMITVANGLYSFSRFRNRLMYCYNKPNCLSPVKTKIAKKSRGKRGKYKKKPVNQ